MLFVQHQRQMLCIIRHASPMLYFPLMRHNPAYRKTSFQFANASPQNNVTAKNCAQMHRLRNRYPTRRTRAHKHNSKCWFQKLFCSICAGWTQHPYCFWYYSRYAHKTLETHMQTEHKTNCSHAFRWSVYWSAARLFHDFIAYDMEFVTLCERIEFGTFRVAVAIA